MMDNLTATLLADKARRRRELAALPIEEKVRILVELQKRAKPLAEAPGKRAVMWDLSDDDGEARLPPEGGKSVLLNTFKHKED